MLKKGDRVRYSPEAFALADAKGFTLEPNRRGTFVKYNFKWENTCYVRWDDCSHLEGATLCRTMDVERSES